ncbi:MAG: exodeoxyribonuclease VII small subunit [Planctomycetota bacterium]|nr:exodeoxyribonuclease VII small subunit [Planctomycetota bacterium]MCB9901900.1 exodeoxyribonuclease VII small subunit [Planctomycetota bacterium]
MVPPPRRPATSKAKTPTFEERLAALEEVVDALEAEDLGLEESLARYREGVAHLEACRALLDEAEARLVELTQGADGRAVERPLQVGENGLEDAAEEE